MRAVETIKNIWKIEDLRKRILITLLLVLIYRFGTYIVLPGIDPKDLTALGEQRWFDGSIGYVFRRSLFKCIHLCIRNYAIYLGLHCDAVGSNCDSVVPEDAARR